MSRRKMRGTPPEKSAIGVYNIQQALNRVDKFCHAAVEALVAVEFTTDDVVNWMFPPDTQRILREAYTMVSSYTSSNLVIQCPTPGPRTALISLGGWEERKMALPQSNGVDGTLFASSAGPLYALVAAVNAIRNDYAIVRKVLQWLDKNGTAGAFRYYFPSVLALVPDLILGDMTGTHREPEGISPLLPLIRSAASTVASSLLLPAKTTKPGTSHICLTFHEAPLTVEGVQVIVPSFTWAI